MQRQRETAPHRILIYCVWACIFLIFVGQIGASPESGLLNLLDFALSAFVFLLPIFLYKQMGQQTHSGKVSILFSAFWVGLFFLITSLFYKVDPLAAAFIAVHTFSFLRFGRFMPPSDQRKSSDGGSL